MINWLVVSALSLILVIMLAMIYLVWNTTRVREEWHEVRSDRLPSSFIGYRIAHLSDLHLEMNYVSRVFLKKWITKVKPDLIVISGDCAESRKGVNRANHYLTSCTANDGVVAVYGNHEYLSSRNTRNRLLEVYNRLGIQLLRNESMRITRGNASIQVVGVDDYCTGHADIPKAFSEFDPSLFTLLVSHDPNVALVLPHGCADLALGGHFHGGQILVPGLFKFHPMGELPKNKIFKGSHQINGVLWYISRGLGQVGYPFRFRSFPELTVHELVANCHTVEQKPTNPGSH